METLKISWSSLRTYVECKQKAKLTRTGHRLSLENQRNFLPGTITDRISRDWLKNPDRRPGEMLEMFEEYFEKSIAEAEETGIVKWKGVEDKQKVRDDCIEAITNLEPILYKMVVPFEHWEDFKFEAPLLAARNGGGPPIHVTLNGYMDYLVRDQHGRMYVFDLKQTRNNDYWKKTEGQLVYYTVATELIFETKVTGVALIQPLASPRVRPVSISADARRALFQDITNMANDVVDDLMPPKKDSEGCAWCPVKHGCEKFKPETTESGGRKIRLLGNSGLDLD